MIWREDEDESGTVLSAREPISLDDIDDGRCKASSWRVKPPQKPTYESHFGVGGFNRCIGSEGHANRLHKDEFGDVFRINPDGTGFRVVRTERPES